MGAHDGPGSSPHSGRVRGAARKRFNEHALEPHLRVFLSTVSRCFRGLQSRRRCRGRGRRSSGQWCRRRRRSSWQGHSPRGARGGFGHGCSGAGDSFRDFQVAESAFVTACESTEGATGERVPGQAGL